MAYVSVPLIVEGFVIKNRNDDFRKLRNDQMPHFHRTLDNYLQYAPAAVMLGMKACGVESRSSWGRMLTSDAFSVAVMAALVNGLKYTIREPRPDGTTHNSFPSGHTATAFMAATMLSKEYGDRYPLVAMGGYAVATATGLMRMANNRHWLGDVISGAGFGILSTELGYCITDLIFKQKGLNHVDSDEEFKRDEKPSFLDLHMGFEIPLSKYDIDETDYYRVSSGCQVGLEGAYFFNPYIGVGGKVSVSGASIITNSVNAEDNRLKTFSACGGAYFSYPLSTRWNIGSKLLCGFLDYHSLQLKSAWVPSRSGVCFGSGVSMTFKARRRYGMRFFLDYALLPPHSKTTNEWRNTLSLGTAFGFLWPSGSKRNVKPSKP